MVYKMGVGVGVGGFDLGWDFFIYTDLHQEKRLEAWRRFFSRMLSV